MCTMKQYTQVKKERENEAKLEVNKRMPWENEKTENIMYRFSD